MSVRIVSCFGPNTYDLYVKRFLETFVQHWDSGIPLTVFYHDMELPDDAKRFEGKVHFANLNELDAEYVAFAAKAKDANGITKDGSYNYRFDAKKFSAKVFATTLIAAQCPEDWIVWLDADTFTHQAVDDKWLDSILDPEVDIVYLGRQGISYSETSFVGFNRKRGKATTLLADMRDMYVDGEIFGYVEQHDGFIFERLLYLHRAHGMHVKSLTYPTYTGLEAFENSPLADKMHHLKGNRKLEAAPPESQQHGNRYSQLNELVRHYAKGKDSYRILETGTWKGLRATELAKAAFDVGVKSVTYMGYDLFEDATVESDKEEFNSKSHNSITDVTATLTAFAEAAKEKGFTFNFTLTKGDTKLTLTKAPADTDFAYLDGGHSKSTVEHDYSAVTHVPVVVFDDYITEDEDGNTQPEEHLGTNLLFDELLKTSFRCIVYDSKDPVTTGGTTHIALIVHDVLAAEPPDLGSTAGAWRQLVVTPHDSVEEPKLISNVEENLRIIPKWVAQCRPHGREMVVVSGGPNVMDDMVAIEARKKAGAYIVAVKHALPYLKKAGILPHAVVVLDPRPLDGTSTHGVVRKDLFDDIPKDTKAWVASMTDPDVTKHLQSKGVEIFGWHAMTKGLSTWAGWPPGSRMISGGTCSAWRAVGIGALMGFQTFHVYGMDLCVSEVGLDTSEKDDQGRQKYLKVSPDKGQTFYWSTGELVAAAQDIKQIMELAAMTGLEVYVHGEGLGPDLWRAGYKDYKQGKLNFEDVA